MNDVMLDLETFGTSSNAVIVSLSAVQFNSETGETGEVFEMGLDLQQQIDKGAILDADTVMWWLKQPEAAQVELTKIYAHPVMLVLEAFNDWLTMTNCSSIWGNGATFDNTLVRNLYTRHKVKFALAYWADRDVRTMVDTFKIDRRKYEFVGTKHKGIDDCMHQINYMVGGKKAWLEQQK